MKEPGPDHPIAIERNAKRVRVSFAGKIIADTRQSLTLTEKSYKPVHYIPRADADMTALKATAHHAHCPYKGDASYFTIEAGGRTAENAVWSYQHPFPAVGAIKDHLAFYSDRVDTIEESET
jgi:uncharacterized protein (DUF427 family)